jgi:hypothetical protein
MICIVCTSTILKFYPTEHLLDNRYCINVLRMTRMPRPAWMSNDDNTKSRTFGPLPAYHCVDAIMLLRWVLFPYICVNFIPPKVCLFCNWANHKFWLAYSFGLNFLDMNCTLRLKQSMWLYFCYNAYMSYCPVRYGTTALKCAFVI